MKFIVIYAQMSSTNIYALKLKNNKYYIGKTSDVQKRYIQHLNSKGSEWTIKHKPISIEKVITNASNFDEDKIVKEYMSKFGIQNVRGGSYSNINLNKSQVNSLKIELKTASNLCYRCGVSGHFSKNCNKYNSNSLDNYTKNNTFKSYNKYSYKYNSDSSDSDNSDSNSSYYDDY